jgi:hypothetical protein
MNPDQTSRQKINQGLTNLQIILQKKRLKRAETEQKEAQEAQSIYFILCLIFQNNHAKVFILILLYCIKYKQSSAISVASLDIPMLEASFTDSTETLFPHSSLLVILTISRPLIEHFSYFLLLLELIICIDCGTIGHEDSSDSSCPNHSGPSTSAPRKRQTQDSEYERTMKRRTLEPSSTDEKDISENGPDFDEEMLSQSNESLPSLEPDSRMSMSTAQESRESDSQMSVSSTQASVTSTASSSSRIFRGKRNVKQSEQQKNMKAASRAKRDKEAKSQKPEKRCNYCVKRDIYDPTKPHSSTRAKVYPGHQMDIGDFLQHNLGKAEECFCPEKFTFIKKRTLVFSLSKLWVYSATCDHRLGAISINRAACYKEVEGQIFRFL